MTNLDYILESFLAEGSEALEQAIDDVMLLEKGFDQDRIDRIFRVLHSLKGNAGMLGFTDMAHFIHRVEDTCSTIRSGDRNVDKPVADTLLKCLDLLVEGFESIRENETDDTDYNQAEALIQALEAPGAKKSPKAKESTTTQTAQSPAKADATCSWPKPRTLCRNDVKALVVDDDFLDRNVMRKHISKYMPCFVASDGAETIKTFSDCYKDGSRTPYDLVILDVMMPNVDGLQATKTIREIERSKGNAEFTKEAIILIASSIDDDQTMLKAIYECGANAYLIKPVTFENVRRQLVRHLLIPPETGA